MNINELNNNDENLFLTHALGITFKRSNAAFSSHSRWSGWAIFIKAWARCLKLFPNNDATPNSVTT